MPPHAPPSPATPSARIPSTYALSLLALMTERGHAQESLLGGTQLTPDQLKAQNAHIDAWQYAVLLVNARRVEPDHGLAYELGLRSQVTKHGFVGFGLISCATLREAIEFSERYLQARVPIFRSTMIVRGGDVVIELRETQPLGPYRSFVLDLAVVELCSLFAKVMGLDPSVSGWTSRIHVPHDEPKAYARYCDRLPSFTFNQDAVEIHFPARMLDEPIATADPVSVQLAIERCEQDLSKQAAVTGTRGQVLAHLRCEGRRYPELAEVAERLHVSERTLKRRLQAEDSCFQVLLDEVRQRDAERLLADPKLAIKQVADAVGYADPANFARAFSKWTGLSPKAWRDKLTTRTGPK